MLVITGKFKVRPQSREQFIQLAHSLFEPSRAESGCISYNFYEDTTDNMSFLFLEEWESQEAIDKHFQTPPFKDFMQRFPTMIAEEPDIKFYKIEGVKQLQNQN